MNTAEVIAIVGPTAVGKTALAITIAQHFNAEIISYDSRQFFREMHIGTAVPSVEERAAVRHHFIQNISIHQPYTLADYEKQALARIQEIHTRGKRIVLVGGSGMYEKAVLQGLDDLPKVSIEVRNQLAQRLELEGLAVLAEELRQKDPEYAATADLENPRRVLRALEVMYSSDKTYSSFRTHKPKKRDFRLIRFGLHRERTELYKRINARVVQMIDAGLLSEAKTLEPFRKLNALQTVGYRELFRYFDGDIDLDFAVSEIQKNTRRFAKRQLTWYRKDSNLPWFHPEDKSAILEFISTNL